MKIFLQSTFLFLLITQICFAQWFLQLEGNTPNEYSLEQNFPYPFNPSAIISYSLPVISQVSLKIYDVLGKEIANLVNEEKSAGEYEVEFNANHLSSGIYFYQLKSIPIGGQAGEFIQAKKNALTQIIILTQLIKGS